MATNPIAPIVTPEAITNAQIGRASDRFADRCRKNATALPKDAVQAVLEDDGDGLAQEMFEALRKRVEMRTNMIVQRVTVNYDKSPKAAIDATNRVQYVTGSVLDTMPKLGSGTEEVDVYFFKLGRYVNAEELEQEYTARNLVPDPYAQAQVNADDPSFADIHPNGTQWNREGRYSSYLAFNRNDAERYLFCDRYDLDWRGYWWFAGRRPRK